MMDRVRAMMERNALGLFEEEVKEQQNDQEDIDDSDAEYEDLLELDEDVVHMPVDKNLFESLPHAKFTQANA